MTEEKHMFQTLTLKEGGSVGFGGKQKGNIIDTCTVGNSSLSIYDVWLVDGLKHNLLSISQFFNSGYVVMFDKNSCIVLKDFDKSILFRGRACKGIFRNLMS
jgi:hypothetical protein